MAGWEEGRETTVFSLRRGSEERPSPNRGGMVEGWMSDGLHERKERERERALLNLHSCV